MTEAQEPAPKHPGGRPSDYSPALASAICAQLADGKSMRAVCKAESMPSMQTVFRWLGEKIEFREQYEKAKEESADVHSEDMLDIADSGSNDWMENNDPDNPGYRANGEHIQRSRLRVDTRKWIASKLKPKKYGDRMTTELTGKDGKDLVPDLTDKKVIDDVARRLAFILSAATDESSKAE